MMEYLSDFALAALFCVVAVLINSIVIAWCMKDDDE